MRGNNMWTEFQISWNYSTGKGKAANPTFQAHSHHVTLKRLSAAFLKCSIAKFLQLMSTKQCGNFKIVHDLYV